MAETTLQIAPSSGQSLLFTQGGPGTAPGYGALDRRRWLEGASGGQPGVFGAAQWKVAQRGAGANLSVDVGQDDFSFGVARVGRYVAAPHNAVANLAVPSGAHATLPRIDSVFLVARDADVDGLGAYGARLVYVEGVATSGATLDNRNGAPAAPGGAAKELLADVLVPAGATSVTAGNIRDRRRAARGVFRRIVRNANAAGGSDYTTAALTLGAVDATNLAPRLELSGNPVRISLAGIGTHSAASSRVWIAPTIDGVAPEGATDGNQVAVPVGVADEAHLTHQWHPIPAAGSRVIAPYWRVQGGTGTLKAQATRPLEFTVEEIVRANFDNS